MADLWVPFELIGDIAESRYLAYRCEVCAAVTTAPAVHAQWHYDQDDLIVLEGSAPPADQPYVLFTSGADEGVWITPPL